MNSDEKSNHYPLVRRPASAIEKAAPGAKRIVAGMVADALSLVKKTRPRRIVVVNDEEMLIKSIQFILRECFNLDSTVLTFDDSEKAWQELLRTDPDLLITDDIMPALGGMEIVRRLANRKAAYPVILTTSFERTELLMCVRDCASRGLKIKLLNAPWDLESFLKAVEDSLKISRAITRPDTETPPIIANADSESWFKKGNSYFESENYTEAVRWYRKAAEQNHAQAQYVLGCCYEDGDGVPQNYTEAARWYRKAAEQNHAEAQLTLGSCYRRGQGVPQNMVEAVQWYRKAAEQGDADAQYSLGMCYQDGQGVVKDEAEAEKWQNKAREKWGKNAEDKLAVAHVDLDALVRKGKQLYNSDEWTEENLQASELFLRAAEAGHGEAQFLVFKCAQHWQSVLASVGECGLQINKTAPIEWLRKSAESGFAEAQCILGLHYDTGQDVIQDAIEAAKWYRKAAEQGYAMAQRYLAACYENGNGVPQNYAEAIKWYREAAGQGDAKAQCWLGMCYATGDGVPKDAVEAYKWVKLALEQGYEDASIALSLVTELLSPEKLFEAERQFHEFRLRRNSVK